MINASAPPQSLQNELKPEEVEQLKVRMWGEEEEGEGEAPAWSFLLTLFLPLVLPQLCMSKRYDGSQRALDLKSLRGDPGKRHRLPWGHQGWGCGEQGPTPPFPPVTPQFHP